MMFIQNKKVQAHSAAEQQFGVMYFVKAAAAGGICCSLTHGAVTPLDVVKTRIQLDPVKYNKGFIGTFRQVVSQEGAGALLTGLGATAAGYFVQGWVSDKLYVASLETDHFCSSNLVVLNSLRSKSPTQLANRPHGTTVPIFTSPPPVWLNLLLIFSCALLKLCVSAPFPTRHSHNPSQLVLLTCSRLKA